MKSRLHIVLAFCLVLCGASLADTQESPPSVLRLTLSQAIARGLQSNLAVLTSQARIDEAQAATSRRAAAALLPRINTQAYASLQNRNLRAFGLSIAGMPQMVGPFSNYYVGLSAQQSVVDLAALRTKRASELGTEAARNDEQDARDLVVRAVAASYLNAQAGQARTESAEARVRDAEALVSLATGQHDAGVATGVDVLRAQVQLANERQSLLVARNQFRQALLTLERQIGIEPGLPLELAEELSFEPQTQPSADILVGKALVARSDAQALAKQRESLLAQLGANQARFYPKLTVGGSFGGLGRSVGSIQAVGSLQGQIDFTLFDRDRQGESGELSARLRSLDARIADLRRGIAEEVHAALLNLESASEQVSVAREGLELARRELEQTRDRFEAGVTNNIEVVRAQDEVARAEENQIVALSSHADANFALARALGARQP